MTPTFSVRAADWSRDLPALRAVRETVFVIEQGVPRELEWDAVDPQCVHALALDGSGAPVGTARLLPDGHIGRVAVLAPWRGRGVGRALMHWMIDAALAQGHAEVALNAQQSAEAFYLGLGFASVGAPFMEAGIPHVAMVRVLKPARSR